MYLPLRAYERDQPIIGRDLERGAYASLLVFVQCFDRRRHAHNLARMHVIVVEALVTRAHYNLVAAKLGEMSRQYGKLLDKDRLYFGVLFAIDLK